MPIEAKALGQHERNRGPEHIEGAEQQCLEGRAPAQGGILTQQAGHRAEDVRIVQAAGRPVCGHRPGENETDDHHQRRRAPEHRAPTKARGDEQRRGPCQHDPGQQASHHIADDAAPPLCGYQMGEQGYEHLGASRAHADDEGGHEEWQGGSRSCHADQAQRSNGDHGQGETAILDQIRQRDQQEQSAAVAELRDADHGARKVGADPQLRANGGDERLGIVEICHQSARRQRKDGDQGRRWTPGVCGRRSFGPLRHLWAWLARSSRARRSVARSSSRGIRPAAR